VIEESIPFSTSAQFELGANLQKMAACRRFAPAGRSALVEHFQLENVIFDGMTGTLFKNGVHIAETRYAMSSSHRFNVDLSRVIKRREESPIFIGFNNWHHNYYHWLTQCIPAMYCAREIHAGVEFVLALPKLNSWQEAALSLAGLSGIKRYTVDPRRQYEVRKLTYSTFTQGVTTTRPSSKTAEVFCSMRSKVGSRSARSHQVIYVSREDTSKRKMLNEAELCDRLKAEGVEIVVPSKYSITEQIEIFTNAKLVIGPHGAGLTNVVFCQPGATLYEIMGDRGINSSIAHLAHLTGLNYWAEAFPCRSPEGKNGEWDADLQDVIKTVQKLKDTTPVGHECRFVCA
jgi:capsular polysaccharide biosynthesis protein